MQKPPYLRENTWDYIQSTWKDLDVAEKRAIVDNPGPHLLDHGLLSHRELLENTVIEENNFGPEYLITPEAANELVQGADQVVLRRLGDNHLKSIKRATIIASIKHGSTFDQL